jgi:hypothetical protein
VRSVLSIYFSDRWAWNFTIVRAAVFAAICFFGGIVFYLVLLFDYYVGIPSWMLRLLR